MRDGNGREIRIGDRVEADMAAQFDNEPTSELGKVIGYESLNDEIVRVQLDGHDGSVLRAAYEIAVLE